jgi:hypothetical protein
MPTAIKIDWVKFQKSLVDRTIAAGYTLNQLKTVQSAVAAGTETTPQGDAVARIVSLALFAACVPNDEPDRGNAAVYLEDRVTGEVVLKP